MTDHETAIVNTLLHATDEYLRASDTFFWLLEYSDDDARKQAAFRRMTALKQAHDDATVAVSALVMERA